MVKSYQAPIRVHKYPFEFCMKITITINGLNAKMALVMCSFVVVLSVMIFGRPVDDLLCCCWSTPISDPLGVLQQPLFVDYSRFMRPMGIVKWNRLSFHLLTFLLFLSGNVQPNPGPDISGLELCSVCSEAVLDDHKAVCCDLCDSWIHVSCDPSLSDDLYANMVQEPSTDPWFCTMCSQFAPVTVSNGHCADHQLSCACLNARSVFPKRFDIFSFICAFHIDILAVTETFLGGTISDGEICPEHYQIFRHGCSRHGGGFLS